MHAQYINSDSLNLYYLISLVTIRFIKNIMFNISQIFGDCGSTVVKVLCYKSEGRWFDPS